MENWAIPRFLRKTKLITYQNGKQHYIDDFINCLIKLKKNKVFNIAKFKQLSILKLAKLIIRLTNSKSKIKFKNPPKSISR